MLPLLDGNLFQMGLLIASWWLADARVGLDSRSCNGLSFAFIWAGRLSTSVAYLSWALAVPIPLSLFGPPGPFWNLRNARNWKWLKLGSLSPQPNRQPSRPSKFCCAGKVIHLL